VPEDGVEVEVDDGVAELTGTVPDEDAAQRAGDVAGHVDGVIGLDNKLEPGAEEQRREED
jgi:osmotically-inducible protein OsmY